ncbi:ferredoxin [Lachnospiraceae bacterium KM106-2]|nr:ferredoxin [Lachnospiraceae bacterium KM106-2]
MFYVNKEKCIACKQCINDCPTKIISLKDGKASIDGDPCLKCGHCLAICPVEAVATDDYDMSEVMPYNEETFYIDPEHLLNFIRFRRSVRRFKQQEVSKEQIAKIIQAGRYTQTGTNSQDVSYIVVQNKLGKLRDLIFESLKKKGDSILANMTPETEFLRTYAHMWLNMYDAYKADPAVNDGVFFHAPVVIFVLSPSQLNGGLASSNMELMVDALGLGTFFSGFSMVAIQDNQAILDLLGVKDQKQLVSCLVVGHPDVTYKRTTPRKQVDINWL